MVITTNYLWSSHRYIDSSNQYIDYKCTTILMEETVNHKIKYSRTYENNLYDLT